MFTIIINGILFGLLLAIMLGPVFFALIQNSIVKGFRAGIYMALGIALADTLYIFLMYFSVRLFRNNDVISMWLGIIGGTIILTTGLISLMKKPVAREEQVKTVKKGFIRQFVKGFALNGINPFVLLYWLGVMTLVTKSYQYTKADMVIFFIALIGTLLITDVAKVALARSLRKWITEKRMDVMNKIVGLALILFSFRLFYYAFEHYV